jgi:hypothetical protein
MFLIHEAILKCLSNALLPSGSLQNPISPPTV